MSLQQIAVPPPPGPGPDEILVEAVTQALEGHVRRLRGKVRLQTSEMILEADEVDYNEDTAYAEARGNVHFRHLQGGEDLHADKVEMWVDEERGRYYNVRGTSPAKIESRPGILSTSNPFYFQGEWADRLKNRYTLHNGFVTNCKMPRPWWTLRGPSFDIIPGERAITRNSWFRLRRVPLFYTPYFYKSLERLPRRSGFLTPNIGNSSRRGFMYGLGYYWAINRSYDLQYLGQYFTTRGFAHHVDFRGKPTRTSDFNFLLYGVNDRGDPSRPVTRLVNGNYVTEPFKAPGYLLNFTGRAALPLGFEGRTNINYLSSFRFRQEFTESFTEAIFSEVNSVGYATRHWSEYTVNLVGQRNENWQTVEPQDRIVIQKLPQLEFRMREKEVSTRVLPVWVSLDSQAGIVERKQRQFEIDKLVDRSDVAPRVTTALRWKDFHLIPSFTARSTHYGAQLENSRAIGQNLTRNSYEVDVELVVPSLARIYKTRGWLGERVKHVIEPRAFFRHVGGINNFNSIIRFDETELLSNTTEAEISLTNRLYSKRKDGQVGEILSWQVLQRRFFDPTFGGALVEGRRNVTLSSLQTTGYSFMDAPRRYSPIVSSLRMQPTGKLGVEWRADYDPLRGALVNSTFTADTRIGRYYVSGGHTQLNSSPVLSATTNNFRISGGYGQENNRGWAVGAMALYDYEVRRLYYVNSQVTYNTDCCGFSLQYRLLNFGTRNENQFRVAFAVANIGSFGTLRRQERMF